MSVGTRERILKAAKEEFSRRGYYRTQISHIVERAGVARGTFYLYFKGKEELFKELLLKTVSELRELIKPVELSRDPKEQVRENLERILRYALENEELARIVLFRACEPELSGPVREFLNSIVKLTEDSLKKGIKMGLLKEHDPHAVARAVVGAVKETVAGLIEEGGDPKELSEKLLSFSVGGLWRD
ncbi:MAG: TetR/AcrR family transcriptional regulator [Aquificae bacterium]|nr:TetR/AcrR family transcriptional regulator [Aquificota bacterium]